MMVSLVEAPENPGNNRYGIRHIPFDHRPAPLPDRMLKHIPHLATLKPNLLACGRGLRRKGRDVGERTAPEARVGRFDVIWTK